MGQTLAEVLRGHRWKWRGAGPESIVLACSCGDKLLPKWSSAAAGVDAHERHLADVVTAWLGTEAGQEAAQAAVNGPQGDEQGSVGVVGRSDEGEGRQ